MSLKLKKDKILYILECLTVNLNFLSDICKAISCKRCISSVSK